MKDIRAMFRKFVHRFYYYVPPCPVCESPMTGRFVKLHRETDTEWQFDESLKHGEIVKAVDEVPSRNLFCTNCGYEWVGNTKLLFADLNYIQMEKERRHTIELRNERVAQEREDRKNDHKPFKAMRRFIGKI